MMRRVSAPNELPAAELAEAYARGTLSPVEAVQACLARVEACEPALNAMYRVHADDALAAARAAEARWRTGQPLSPLDGVPVTVKENIHTRGVPSPIGTQANEDAPPQAEDAPPAARLREAGCVILGKTTMPDYGMLSSGVSSLHGTTRNPWRLDRNPSGSSSGAAAAAAAGYAPLHLGTDIGGSIRLPAAHCGVFGLKPSLGRVPIYPPYIGRVVGPMTRDVGSAAMLLSVLARPDARDFMSLPYEARDYTSELERFEPRGLRVGLLLEAGGGLAVRSDVRAAVQEAARALEQAGSVIEPVARWLPPEVYDGMGRFFEARLYADFSRLPPERQARVLAFIAEWCTWRASTFSGRDVMDAYHAYLAMREGTLAATARFDYVLAPVSPIVAYEAELPSPTNDPRNAFPHILFTLPFNMSEQPAASVNWTWSAEGLPIGVQAIGRRFDDAGVLGLARFLEKARPPQRPWPASFGRPTQPGA